MEIVDIVFNSIKVIKFDSYVDSRGSFSEIFRQDLIQNFGIHNQFVQENQSISRKNVIRGLHLQYNPKQSKLIRVVKGIAKFVELDFRPVESFGKIAEFTIKDTDNILLWVPFGFANGFVSLSDELIVNYKVTNYWNSQGEVVIRYNSPELNINWGVPNPIVSTKDQNGLTFTEFCNLILPKIEF